MKNYSYFKMLVVACGLIIGFSTVKAQSGDPVDSRAEKVQLREQSGANYDSWKQAAIADAPNQVVNTQVANGYTTHTIQLGWNLADKAAADQYTDKLAAQGGVVQVSADFETDRVEITVKEEDEYNVLYSFFDIQ